MVKELIKIRLGSIFVYFMTGEKKDGVKTKISKGKGLLFAFLLIFAAAQLTMLISILSNWLGSLLIPNGFASVYLGMFMVMTFTAVFILSIFETKATLYEGRDNELLLSMPIPVKDIIISRIFTVLIFNYALTALIMTPAVAVYGIYGTDVGGIIGGILVMLFIPLLATALSSGVGYFVAVISQKMKNTTLITVIISLVFLAAYFAAYTYIIGNIDSLAQMSPELAAALAENLGIFGLIGSAALLNPMPLCVLILLSVISAALAYLLISKNYISIMTSNAGTSRAALKIEKYTQKSAFYALVSKEFRAFFSSANYILNAGLGSVFGIFVSVMMLFNKETVLSIIPQLLSSFPEISSESDGFIAVLASAALFAVSSMSFISAPALSLEGKSFWILKSLPVSAKEYLLAKTVPHIVISGITSLLSSVIMIFALQISLEFWAFVILIPLFGAFFSGFLGTLIGAAFPKFDYASDMQVIKQSAASSISIFSSMLFSVGSSVGAFFLMSVIPAVAVGILLLLFIFVLTAALLVLLLTVMARKLEKI